MVSLLPWLLLNNAQLLLLSSWSLDQLCVIVNTDMFHEPSEKGSKNTIYLKLASWFFREFFLYPGRLLFSEALAVFHFREQLRNTFSYCHSVPTVIHLCKYTHIPATWTSSGGRWRGQAQQSFVKTPASPFT